ncbi:Shikimate dehydrogenase [Rhizobium sp. CF080]|uniref:shikimate dehydrogenase n=1 Tax=Rhizobium sp. (strain CF080) TaxID=1144310 RepID=UPI00027192DF|nr:shikimate dehydrogenase [Rhizobium sp. CF080]EUB99313.1 Shikimate dehydrogenase [Rhizobium sp. CF080]
MVSKRAFVMGHPIAHSRSPMLHGYWLKRYGLEGSYERLDIPPQEIDAFFAGFRDAGWIGGNVTVPHKTAVIPHLDSIDDAATKMGAVNTIWWQDGKLLGGNTDAIGFLGNIDELVPGWEAGTKKAVIFGAGGATRAAAYGLQSRGLQVALCNRTLSKAQALADHFGAGVGAHKMDELGDLLADCDLLVNATSLGMIGQPPLDIDLSPLKKDAIVYDVVYVPLETQILKTARERGHRTVDGLGMLLHQAVVGFERWFKHKPDVTTELRQILIDDIRAKTPGA